MEDKIGTWKIAADCLRQIATSRQLDGAAKDAELQGGSQGGSLRVCRDSPESEMELAGCPTWRSAVPKVSPVTWVGVIHSVKSLG